MIFWKDFKKHKPKYKGWYNCTVQIGNQQKYTMSLYWYPDRQKFLNNVIIGYIDGYADYLSGVYGFDIWKNKDKLEKAEPLIDRTSEVIAWRKIPKAYMKGLKK